MWEEVERWIVMCVFAEVVGTEDVMWYAVGIENGVLGVRTFGSWLAVTLVWVLVTTVAEARTTDREWLLDSRLRQSRLCRDGCRITEWRLSQLLL